MYYFSSSVGIQLRMLPVPQIDHELLFCFGVETEVSLICEIVTVEQHLNEGGLGHENLGLFTFSTK